MPSHEHLSDDLIRKFGLGQIRGEISTYIDLHLTMCEACQIRLKQLSGTEFRHRPKTGIITREESVPNLEISQSIQIKTIPYIPASNIPPELLSLKQYTNIRELGKGGMGVVYLATNTRMDRDEVLKVVNKTLLERDGALDRFEREIKAAGRLNHKNIVTAYSSEQVGDMLILSMEYVPGEDLAKVVKDHGPVSVMKACYYALQTANGLQHAHERGLVHRDIKPSNLILVKSGKRLTVKILDFGLAKSTRKDSEQPELTGTGNILGTPSYMAPEQIRNSATADIRADLYSLGCTIQCLLTGKPPFVGDSAIELMMAHTTQMPAPLHELRPDVPTALSEIVAKLLAKQPEDRFQTPAELARALMPFVKTKPIGDPIADSARATTTIKDQVEVTRIDPPSTPQLTAIPLASPTPRRRWPMFVAIAAAWCAIAVGVGAIFVQTPDGTLEITQLAPDADVIVNGAKVRVLWSNATKSAELRLRPGTHQLEVKQGDQSIVAEKIEIRAQDRLIIAAKRAEPEVKAAPEPSPIAKFAPVGSEWCGLGLTEGDRTTRVATTMTVMEWQGENVAFLLRWGWGPAVRFRATCDSTGRLTINTRERVRPNPIPPFEKGGTGRWMKDKLVVSIDGPSKTWDYTLKRLPDGGANFNLNAAWHCEHFPSRWRGTRVINGTSFRDFNGRIGNCERDGGLVILQIGGGREWVAIDPDNPNKLYGSNGSQEVIWTRQ